jgi:hypothetical protein
MPWHEWLLLLFFLAVMLGVVRFVWWQWHGPWL